ncbi:hypothetical protein Tco_0537188 [Tanacetum coccineum]
MKKTWSPRVMSSIGTILKRGKRPQRIQHNKHIGTTPEGSVLLGPERPRTYEDLSDTEKKRYDADVRATNIVLQGLPKDIYKLINHNIEAKAIWDNVKILLAGSELTKEDIESQLYDELCGGCQDASSENINSTMFRFSQAGQRHEE